MCSAYLKALSSVNELSCGCAHSMLRKDAGMYTAKYDRMQ